LTKLARDLANFLYHLSSRIRYAFFSIQAHYLSHGSFLLYAEGFIQNRTQEHLGYTDQAVLLGRQVLMKAIQAVQEGKDPPHVLRTSPEVPTLVAAHAVLPAGVDWHGFWETQASDKL